jgi:heme-degrading monooxygenase HmoA
MFIAMNRFRIALGKEEEFIQIWKSRETYVETVAGFKEFHLLQGATDEHCTLFASHTVWNSKEAFEAWTNSEAFQKAHASAGGARDMYLGPPNFEGFEAVI